MDCAKIFRVALIMTDLEKQVCFLDKGHCCVVIGIEARGSDMVLLVLDPMERSEKVSDLKIMFLAERERERERKREEKREKDR